MTTEQTTFPTTIYQTPSTWGETTWVSDDESAELIESLEKVFDGELNAGELIKWDLLAATNDVAIYGRTASATADGKWLHTKLTVALVATSEDGYFAEFKG